MSVLRSIVRFFSDFGENFSAALESLRVAKGRSALTILGVVIGVSTVMAMASIVAGIRDQIVSTIEIAGPTTFYVMKIWSQTPINPQDLPKWVRIRPDLTPNEAEHLAALPEISYAGIWAQSFSRIEFGGARTQPGPVPGAANRYPPTSTPRPPHRPRAPPTRP